jgi:hypothetical protein
LTQAAARRREMRRVARIDVPFDYDPDEDRILNLRGLQWLTLDDLTDEQALALNFGPIMIPVRYDDWGSGHLVVDEDDNGNVFTPWPQLLPIDHPALPQTDPKWQPALWISVDTDGGVMGLFAQIEAGLASSSALPFLAAWLGFVVGPDDLQKFLGLEDLQDLSVEMWQGWASGELFLDAEFDSFKLDGVFPGAGRFRVRGDHAKLDANALVEAEGIAADVVTIQRDPLGQLTAKGDLKGDLTTPEGHKLSGQLKAEFSRGVFSITGSATYKWTSGEGALEVQIADYDTAWKSVRDWLGDQAPTSPLYSDAPLGLVLVGRGSIRFDENEWLSGTAEAVLDPDGYVTAIGRLTPSKKIEIFGRQSIGEDKKVHLFGSPWSHSYEFIAPFPIGPVWATVDIDFTAHASIGPGTLENIVVDGNFTTRPGVAAEFSISADLVVPGTAGLDLTIDSAAYAIAGSAHVKIGGSVTLDAEASVTPKIGRERHPADPAKAIYFIEGTLRASGVLTLSLSGEAWIKPLHVKRVTLADPGGKMWTLGRGAVSFTGRYNLTSEEEANKVKPKWTHLWPDFDSEAAALEIVHGRAPKGSGGSVEEDYWRDEVKPLDEEPHLTPHTPGGSEATVEEEVPTLAESELPPYTAAPDVGPKLGEVTQAAGAPTPKPPPPPPPGTASAAPGPPPTPPPLWLRILMSDQPHVLELVRDQPAHIEMASGTPEPLRPKLAASEDAIEEEAEQAQGGQIVEDRTENDLQEEEKDLDKLLDEVIAVEEAANDVPDPTNPPAHVPGFEQLGGHMEAYGNERGRTELPVAPTPGAPPPLPDRPKELDGTKTPAFDQVWRTNRKKGQEYLDDGLKKHPSDKDALAKYVDGRAARRLGRDVEKPTLVKYNELTGYGVTKNSLEIEVMDAEEKWQAWEPDFIKEGTVVGDIKNVAYQSFSPQMKADVAIAKGKNARWKTTKKPITTTQPFDLIVRDPDKHKRGKTTVSGPLRDAVERETKGQVRELITDPET